MDRFNVGDKVYSKKGSTGQELGTVAVVKDGKVFVRLFENHFIQEFFPEELMTQQEHKQKEQDWMSQMPKNDKNWGI